MAEYRRLISYIYEYEGDEKGKNVGFVKLEARNGQCRLSVNVKRLYVGGNAIGVYLLSRSEEPLCLGNMFVRGGGGEFRTTVDANNVEGSGVGLDGFYGLTVHDVQSAWRSYTTIWEDADAAPGPMAQEVLPGSSDIEEPALNPGIAQEIEEEIYPAEAVEVSDVQEMPADLEGKRETESQNAAGTQELEDPEILRHFRETEDVTQDPEILWLELRKNHPKIQPFDYDGGSEVLTIRPQDIGKLPRENWIYGNNSFLLHGYYNFRYLILIRLEQAGAMPRYLIGIPGHYYSNEKYMATMFGFPNFVLSKKQPPNDGRFGYWYTDIKMG